MSHFATCGVVEVLNRRNQPAYAGSQIFSRTDVYHGVAFTKLTHVRKHMNVYQADVTQQRHQWLGVVNSVHNNVSEMPILPSTMPVLPTIAVAAVKDDIDARFSKIKKKTKMYLNCGTPTLLCVGSAP